MRLSAVRCCFVAICGACCVGETATPTSHWRWIKSKEPTHYLFKVPYHLLCSLKRFLLHESLSRSRRYNPDTLLFPSPDMETFISSQLVWETVCYMIHTYHCHRTEWIFIMFNISRIYNLLNCILVSLFLQMFWALIWRTIQYIPFYPSHYRFFLP